MEIHADIYIITDSRELMEKVTAILSRSVEGHFPSSTVSPDPILPLSRTWYTCESSEGPTSGPGGWEDCLNECAALLKRHGTVILNFTSPDHPDGYRESANTTADGDVVFGTRCALSSFKQALGVNDVRMVYRELSSGRTRYERDALYARRQKREARRQAKGDFEIVGNVLKKYWGVDTDEEIPDGVTVIGQFAFVDERGWERMLLECEEYDAPPLEHLAIPESVRRIETYALAYCMNLKKLSIPDGVTCIEARAFEGCESLKSVKLPAGLRTLGESAFFLCEKLRKIAIPSGVTRIEPGTFHGCMELRRVDIPDTIVSIGKDAFLGCDALKRITLPEGVTEIGESAFQGCSALEEINIPQSVRHIGQNAFKGCDRLPEDVRARLA